MDPTGKPPNRRGDPADILRAWAGAWKRRFGSPYIPVPRDERAAWFAHGKGSFVRMKSIDNYFDAAIRFMEVNNFRRIGFDRAVEIVNDVILWKAGERKAKKWGTTAAAIRAEYEKIVKESRLGDQSSEVLEGDFTGEEGRDLEDSSRDEREEGES